MILDHIAIIVSSEDGVSFYKGLGFCETSRVVRPHHHDELIYLSDGNTILEIYKDPTHPKRVSNPEANGLRHLCFRTDTIGDDYQVDERGRFRFLYDPDGLPIEIREISSLLPGQRGNGK